MEISKCKHLRVRDSNDYNMDIEKFMKSLEKQFKIDFRLLPQWKELIEKLNIVQTEYKLKVQNATNRKIKILQNIFIQNSRPTPFELTDKLARTSKLWQHINLTLKKRKVYKLSEESLPSSSENINVVHELVGEVSDNKSTAHPNTEVVQSIDYLDVKPDTDLEFKSPSSAYLPTSVCTNPHKFISPIGSKYSPLKNHEFEITDTELKSEMAIENYIHLTPTKLVKYHPKEILITDDSLKQQSTKLLLTNCSNEYLHIRFKKISDHTYFKNVKVLPSTTIKLYPGLSAVLKFIYSLQSNNKGNVISSLLTFRIGRNVLLEIMEEVLCVPVISKFIKSPNVSVSETVHVPPTYSWHVTAKLGYPKTVVGIQNNENVCYNLYIRKKYIDFYQQPDVSFKSDGVISSDSEILVPSIEDNEIESRSKILCTANTKKIVNSNFEDTNNEEESIKNIDIVLLVLNDLINLALEQFIFKQTYIRIPPRSRKIVFVYFTNIQHIGYHQCYYDFVFCDIKNDDIVICKPVKVFAEVWPHPIILEPNILDMTNSPITFGYWEDYFKIINSHKVYPVTIKIKTTPKMKKIFKIVPMETLVPPKSSVNFEVKICLRKTVEARENQDLAYFTIKIVMVGHKSVYANVPPFFYEIIAPCATEFKQVYGKKYFIDVVDSSEINHSDLLTSCENL